MTKNDDKSGKTGSLGPEDLNLWKEMTGDVKKLPGKGYEAPNEVSGKEKPALKKQPKERPVFKSPPEKPSSGASNGVDRRTNERLRKGQMPIEARLDLHGMNQSDARHSLQQFLQNAYAHGKRCILVITGKGQPRTQEQDTSWQAPKPGILRQRVPEWLAEPPLLNIVLKTHPAQPKDGGEGALYILLRRQRD